MWRHPDRPLSGLFNLAYDFLNAARTSARKFRNIVSTRLRLFPATVVSFQLIMDGRYVRAALFGFKWRNANNVEDFAPFNGIGLDVSVWAHPGESQPRPAVHVYDATCYQQFCAVADTIQFNCGSFSIMSVSIMPLYATNLASGLRLIGSFKIFGLAKELIPRLVQFSN